MKTIEEFAGLFGPELTAQQSARFRIYQEMLLDWNERINLTAITDPQEIALKHFADSLSIAPYLKRAFKECAPSFPELSLIDVGTGAGFPGIPLKIAYPQLSVTLLDSLQKRVAFLDAVLKALALERCAAVHSRAEDTARMPAYREAFDIATARAVAGMPVLCEYCLPYVKIGGLFLAMKSDAREETEASARALKLLGGEIEAYEEFLLPESDIRRSVILIRKTAKTPSAYPRKAGKPEKDPL